MAACRSRRFAIFHCWQWPAQVGFNWGAFVSPLLFDTWWYPSNFPNKCWNMAKHLWLNSSKLDATCCNNPPKILIIIMEYYSNRKRWFKLFGKHNTALDFWSWATMVDVLLRKGRKGDILWQPFNVFFPCNWMNHLLSLWTHRVTKATTLKQMWYVHHI